MTIDNSVPIAAGWALLAAALTGPAVAKADTGSAPPGHAYVLASAARETAERERMDAALRRYIEGHAEIPAFARKYGMKCSACHFAVPMLNAYGQAFKDNGYRMKEGTDDLRANEPGYWPVFAWLWKGYQLDAVRSNGQTVQQQGGFTNGQLVFGGLGSISDKLSFRLVPIIYEDGRTVVDHGWIKCHGDGSGNGPSAQKGLQDDWGASITPADLTLGRGKWARTSRDIYLRATAGINGTPMPEAGDALKPAEVWEIVHYIQALGGWSGSTRDLREFVAQLPPPGQTPQ